MPWLLWGQEKELKPISEENKEQWCCIKWKSLSSLFLGFKNISLLLIHRQTEQIFHSLKIISGLMWHVIILLCTLMAFLMRHNIEVLALTKVEEALIQLPNNWVMTPWRNHSRIISAWTHLLVMLYMFLSSPDMKNSVSVIDISLSKCR